jgi:Tfp pilus assembly protein PilO
MSRLSEVKEQLRSPLPWHFAGVGILLILVIVLGVRFTLDWIETSGSKSDELASRQTQLKLLEMQTAPLRGIDKRVDESRKQIAAFYEKRIPTTYSTIAAQIGQLAVMDGVRLTRMQYAPGKPGQELTEVKLDATISGEYTSIMKFINGLERDEDFFVIRSMNLTGQQAGTVNLRLQVSTWMRPADAANMPANDEDDQGTPSDEKKGNAGTRATQKGGE